HYTDTHNPYTPPPPYDKLYFRGQVAERFQRRRGNILFHAHENFSKEEIDGTVSYLRAYLKADPAALKYVLSQYDGEIRYVDDHIGALLDELRDLRLLDKTLIILTSDHGEEFMDHGDLFHGPHLYDEILHAPLVVRLPGAVPKGKVVDQVVRSIDVMPTILDILDLQPRITMQGTSLLPSLDQDIDLELEAYAQSRRDPPFAVTKAGRTIRRHLKEAAAVRTDGWKLISTHDLGTGAYEYELYDLRKDPKESVNLAARRREVTEVLKQKLRRWREDGRRRAD
ncbi:MAG: sulfatase-like hydrolase/transferase, partial [Elusimicrobia bacterium]|nr:sulfatase-like hydrolase/transferase [Elusimicrobiota bacterium]